MDYLYKNRRPIVVILACTLIGLGVFQASTGIEINSSVIKGVEYAVMFGALYLLLVLPKKYNVKEDTEVKEVKEAKASEESEASQEGIYQQDLINNERKEIED